MQLLLRYYHLTKADVLAAHGAKATFFITGNNIGKGEIDIEQYGWPNLLRRMHKEGHQIAAHTWTHQNLSALNDTELEDQFHYVEMALRNVLGFIPTYWRPPYSSMNKATSNMAERLGYHVGVKLRLRLEVIANFCPRPCSII